MENNRKIAWKFFSLFKMMCLHKDKWKSDCQQTKTPCSQIIKINIKKKRDRNRRWGHAERVAQLTKGKGSVSSKRRKEPVVWALSKRCYDVLNEERLPASPHTCSLFSWVRRRGRPQWGREKKQLGTPKKNLGTLPQPEDSNAHSIQLPGNSTLFP